MSVVPSRTGCPACGAPCEREEEDGLLKWVCIACEYEFGFEQLGQAEDECSLGIPESLRLTGRSIDIPAELTEEGRVFLGLPRRPE